MNGRLLLPCAFAVVSTCATGRAAAQTAVDKAMAEALYDESKRLLTDGDVAGACERLATSNSLDAGIGALLLLGDCYERLGRSASAWATYREAAAMASKQSDRRESIARTRGAALEPSLARLVIHATGTSGLALSLDGKPIPYGALGVAMPVDPGEHTLAASAPGKATWQTHFELAAGQPPYEIAVPPLTPPAAPLVPSDEGRGWPWQRYAGVAAFATAGALAGVSAGLFVDAKSRFDGAVRAGDCSTDNVCNASGIATYERARTEEGWALALAVAAGGAAAAGVVFFALPTQAGVAAPRSVRAVWTGAGGAVVVPF